MTMLTQLPRSISLGSIVLAIASRFASITAPFAALIVASIIASIMLVIAPASAQLAQPRNESFGAYGSLAINMHDATLAGIPGVASCAPTYESGTGLGPTFGVLYERPLSDRLLLGLRAGYASRGATLRVDETQTVAIDDEATEITIEHSIDASLASLTLAPTIGWRFGDAFVVNAGAEIGYILASTFSQEERISDDDRRGRFENGRRIRNEAAGDIPSASSIHAALQLGVSADLPVNSDKTLFIAPEATFAYGITPIIAGESWSAHGVRLGAAIKYSPRAEVTPIVIAPPAPQPTMLEATVRASGVAPDGTDLPVAQIRVEEQIASDVKPLLNYLFFDDGSSALPGRYEQISGSDDSRRSVDSLHLRGPLAAYHNVLNIVGYRLREHPSATLRVVGTNTGAGIEASNRALSRARAESVRNYLRDRWGIESERLTIEALDMPSVPSNPNVPEGVAENRRVELYASDPSILAPVRTADTARETTPPSIRFRTDVRSDAAIATWRLVAQQNGDILREFSGDGAVPATLEWEVEREQASVPRAPGTLTYELSLTDANGKRFKTSNTLPVEQVTLRSKRRSLVDDMLVERFNMLLFEFDRADIRDVHRRLIDELRTQLTAESHVTVVGYADKTGDESRNKRLAQERAIAVARELGLDEARIEAWGDTAAPYDQSLPEGRFYSRGVVVEIQTPIKAEPKRTN